MLDRGEGYLLHTASAAGLAHPDGRPAVLRHQARRRRARGMAVDHLRRRGYPRELSVPAGREHRDARARRRWQRGRRRARGRGLVGARRGRRRGGRGTRPTNGSSCSPTPRCSSTSGARRTTTTDGCAACAASAPGTSSRTRRTSESLAGLPPRRTRRRAPPRGDRHARTGARPDPVARARRRARATRRHDVPRDVRVRADDAVHTRSGGGRRDHRDRCRRRPSVRRSAGDGDHEVRDRSRRLRRRGARGRGQRLCRPRRHERRRRCRFPDRVPHRMARARHAREDGTRRVAGGASVPRAVRGPPRSRSDTRSADA